MKINKKSKTIYEGWFSYSFFTYVLLNYVLHIDIGILSTVFLVFLGLWLFDLIEKKKVNEYEMDDRSLLEEEKPQRYFGSRQRIFVKKEKTPLYDERELI